MGGAFVEDDPMSGFGTDDGLGAGAESRDYAVVEQVVVEHVLGADQEGAGEPVNWRSSGRKSQILRVHSHAHAIVRVRACS